MLLENLRNQEDKQSENWILNSVWAFFFIGTLVFFWPSLIKPFGFFEFWTIKGDLWSAITKVWPLYLWGTGMTMLAIISSGNLQYDQRDPGSLFAIGVIRSVLAGVLEEVCFRWLLFLSAMVMIPFMNWLLLGFMGLDIIKFIYVSILCPVANFFTLGWLEEYLLNGYGWAVAAAIVSSNGRFRNGHAYLGWGGFVNSWFIGMYLHLVVFTNGLIAAIIIHFLYDFFIFTLEAIMVGLAKKQRFS
ncbi:MAG: CPBP family intramembrane metalloprotease [Bdellovibrionales bacterium]|nr:CPBP family intramembrane metalloprotease [Bdellovibrionales bacterium]